MKKTYRVHYTFTVAGVLSVQAESEEEACAEVLDTDPVDLAEQGEIRSVRCNVVSEWT